MGRGDCSGPKGRSGDKDKEAVEIVLFPSFFFAIPSAVVVIARLKQLERTLSPHFLRRACGDHW